MEHQLLIALLGFATITLFTPGPNNAMLMASGANYGLRRSLPHLLGVALGFPAMVALMGLGIDDAFRRWPVLVPAMKIASIAYMLWLAWKMARAGAPKAASAEDHPLSFLQAAAFQWVNPKAWAMGLGALSAYAAGLGGSLWVVVIFVVIGIPSALVWTVLGQGMRRALTSPARLRVFNVTMAVALVASMLPVIWH